MDELKRTPTIQKERKELEFQTRTGGKGIREGEIEYLSSSKGSTIGFAEEKEKEKEKEVIHNTASARVSHVILFFFFKKKEFSYILISYNRVLEFIYIN